MLLPHDAFVMVADGRKMLFFRNQGDAARPDLVVEHAREHVNPPDREQSSDAPGSAFSSNGSGRSSHQETDFHQLEEERFAAETAAMLRQRAFANDYEKLVVIAPPRTLGALRKHYHKEVADRLIAEIDKNLTGHPVDQIEKALIGA
ncbi:protein required for attachment to host cells [Hephaestia caeni]|uniref:Protein required for attachment to host cells n=1 Tax=Hephaestia caeni TaxID=645617 RepID=A0A397PAI2_9SPHN|nr:host attachment family protein [Hephaestia caeni]RIA46576.1 protein required for attachment to host cells [Hephaestia caeni]